MSYNILLESVKHCKQILDTKKTEIILSNKASQIEYKRRVTTSTCDFMDISYNTCVSNIDVTKYLLNYVEINNLRSQKNHNSIIPDNKLKNLFNIYDNSEISYLNIQKYISKLFIV